MNDIFNVVKRIYEEIKKQPYGTDCCIFIEDIIIPEDFLQTRSRKYKQVKSDYFYHKHKYIDVPIKVCIVENNSKEDKYFLLDEYTRYLTLKKFGIKYIPVKIVDNI